MAELDTAEPRPIKGPWGFWATLGWSTLIAAVADATRLATQPGGTLSAAGGDVGFDASVVALATIMAAPIVAGLAWLLVKIRKGPDPRSYLGLHWPTGKAVVIWTVAFLGIVFATAGLADALWGPIVSQLVVDMHRSTSFLPAFWIAVVIGAPVAEETLFRGFLFRGWAQSRLGAHGTVLLTAVLWAGSHTHYELHGVAYLLIVGITLGYARLRTGSLLLCIGLHSVMNLIATLQIIV